MNSETGAVKELATEVPVGVGEIGLRIGDIILVNKCALKLTAMNTGKRRLTFTTMPRKRAAVELARAERAAAQNAEAMKQRIARGAGSGI